MSVDDDNASHTHDEETTGYLTQQEGAFLLRLARHSIAQALEMAASAPEAAPSQHLEAPGAAFVTLHTRAGKLRGCIGSLIAQRPLVEDVKANAHAAAFEDPRFPPLTAAELSDIVIEVSVLSQPELCPYEDGADLIQKLRPGVDGVIIERGWHRATFLPQVWDQLSLAEEFLAHLCYKAGLSAHTWRDGSLKVSTYQVQEFEEGL